MTYNFPVIEDVFDHLIVHCAATPPSMDIDAAWIDRVHRQRGFARCGYHLFIKRDGTVEYEGTGARTRPFTSAGAHVGGCGPGWNRRSLGVSMAGGVKEDGRTPENNFTVAQFLSLRRVIAEAVDAFGIPEANIMGHRDLIKLTNAAPKACPCFSVKEWLNTPDQISSNETDRWFFNWMKGLRPALQRNDKMAVHKTYTVRAGDTLWGISRTLGVRVVDIRSLNKLTTDTITVGQKLRLLN